MTRHMTGTRDEWLAARLGLLQQEMEHTRRSDEPARRRQQLLSVRLEEEYRFEIDQGSTTLADLFSDGAGPIAEIASMAGTDAATYTRDRPGVSAFALDSGAIYHTYSAFSRGMDGLWGEILVARPRAKGPQRDRRLVTSPRQYGPWLAGFDLSQEV
ncbi:DUF899 family protein [Rhodopila sp.]|uniref:DUF899 family protein n=1 Tax=Rhodopila sp. TaxID=2480087 RepID=UPI003D0B7A29